MLDNVLRRVKEEAYHWGPQDVWLPSVSKRLAGESTDEFAYSPPQKNFTLAFETGDFRLLTLCVLNS